MWKCKKVYPTRGRLGEQLSDLEMSQQVGSSAEKRSRRNGPQRQFSTSSRLGSAKCPTPCASRSTPSAASPRSRTCSVEQSALPASENSKPPSERRRNLSGHPVGRAPDPEPPTFAAYPGRRLPVGNESSRSAPSSALSEKAPHLPSPSAPAGARPFPHPAGGRHNRRPSQPLPRTPASQPANSMLWHLLCKCEGPTPPRGDAKSTSTISSMRSLNFVFGLQPRLMWTPYESRAVQAGQTLGPHSGNFRR